MRDTPNLPGTEEHVGTYDACILVLLGQSRLVAWLGKPWSKPNIKTGVERLGHHHSVYAL